MASNKRDTRYIFITDVLKNTVTDSAIINWLEIFEKEGLVFDVILTTRFRHYCAVRTMIKNKIEEAQKKISGSFYRIPLIFGIAQMQLFIALSIIFLGDMLRGRRIVLHTRVPHLIALRLLKLVYKNVYIVYDVRGAEPEEFLFGFKNRYKGNALKRALLQNALVEKQAYKSKIGKMSKFASLADTVLCVSSKLQEYLLDKSPGLNAHKIRVIPGSAEQSKFCWSPAARDGIRQKLNIENKFVLLYSGGLNTAWQMPDFIFDVFARLAAVNSNVFLICLTPHTDIVSTYMQKHSLREDQVWSGYIKYEDVSPYLSAADAGLLFREDTPTNNVASPTKFAEYLLAGLPVIISEGIGDFSDFITKYQTGLVVNNQSDNLIVDIEDNIIHANFDRETIASLARDHFTKEKNLAIFMKTYKQK